MPKSENMIFEDYFSIGDIEADVCKHMLILKHLVEIDNICALLHRPNSTFSQNSKPGIFELNLSTFATLNLDENIANIQQV